MQNLLFSIFLTAFVALLSSPVFAQASSYDGAAITGPLYTPENIQPQTLNPSMPESGGASPGDSGPGAGQAASSAAPAPSASSPQVHPRPEVQPQAKVLYRVPVRARL
ncbi:MAG: hypothetical protein VKJ04_09300 [Vampirovibrionales bacterium]|nr:hypothetical protein [Vampirovibrionales bacterium]